MKKILLSLGMIVFVGAVVVGATGAFYGDTETSTGNTFTAGSVELLVDSESHYNGMDCVLEDQNYVWRPTSNEEAFGAPVGFPVSGSPCDGTWSETDLEEGIHKFFSFEDIKPGDRGEDTISLHVIDNDAWGWFEVDNVVDRDNTCTEPEVFAEATTTGIGTVCEDPNGDGEVDDYLRFTAWLDQGSVSGFQCGNPELNDTGAECVEDPTEGDNMWQESEPVFWEDELISNLGPFAIADVLGEAYDFYGCSDTDGNTEYGECQGLAKDGRMVGSTTYYFGLAWEIDLQEAGNEIQTDEYTADMTFRVEQHRNNPQI